MGERALVARRDDDGEYDCHRTQWADTGRLVDTAARGQCPATETGPDWRRCGRAEWLELVDRLNYLNLDLCLRCDPEEVRAYRPVWLGVPAGGSDGTDSTCGTLLRVASREEFARLGERIRRRKERLGETIENGPITPREARRSLLTVAGSRECYLSVSGIENCFGGRE